MEDDTTNPVDGGDTSVEEIEALDTEVETEAQDDDVEDSTEGDEPEGEQPEEEEEYEEIEWDGRKAKIPAFMKDGFLRQADYTQKTQALAEERKALQTERATIQQATNAEIAALASVQGIEAELARYSDIDWDTWYNQDPQAAQVAESRFNRLTRQRGEVLNQFTQLRQQRTIQEQQETARLVEEGRKVLARDIAGWDDNLARELLDTGVKEYGFARDEIEDFTDPRMVKVLHDAHQWRKAQSKQKAVQNHTAAQQAKPAARVKARTAPATGLDDRLSADEWVKRRNAQLRKRG